MERGGYRKKWKDKTPVALIYPNSYSVGMSSLGFQLVYGLLNENDKIVCERFFLPEDQERLLSFESARPLRDFSCVFISVSFEHDYSNIIHILVEGGIEPFAADRHADGNAPLVVFGGVATFMNPEPIAPFADAMLIGEAEPVLGDFLELYLNSKGSIEDFLFEACQRIDGVYVPGFYTPHYDEFGSCSGMTARAGVPERVRRVYLADCRCASHSQLFTPLAEFADLHLTELGRGCSRGCRFCAAGYIYRPPRLWDGDAVVQGLAERPGGIDRVGLLGMEMAHNDVLDRISGYIMEGSCALSFSSLRADRINDKLLTLLAASNLKSVAIAPDGASERLRMVINKGLSRADLLRAARRLTEAGIYKLKLYVMIGLPTERCDDLMEFIDMVGEIKDVIDIIGRPRGRLTEIHVSANCFVPKPWTPFQFHPFGVSLPEDNKTYSASASLKSLRDKLSLLKQGFKTMANVHFQAEKPDNALFQAVLARGDRRLASVLADMVIEGRPWKSSAKRHSIDVSRLILSAFDEKSFFPWYIIDHSVKPGYLWQEYKKAFRSVATESCDPAICRRCGVCGER